jgi:hypothetical protein
MKRHSLARTVLRSRWMHDGIVESTDGAVFKGFEVEPLSSGLYEEAFDGPQSEGFFQKLSELLSRLPNHFEGQVILFRSRVAHEIPGLRTRMICFERVQREEGYSHFNALLSELKLMPVALTEEVWRLTLPRFSGHTES